MATKIEWETLKGHAGLQFRRFGNELSFRFRQRQHAIDFLGVMPQEKAIRIAGELRDNRSTGAGPQTWKDMQDTHAEQAIATAIVEKKERKRIIATERLALENTVGSFWDRVYWPHKSQLGSNAHNKNLSATFEKWIKPYIGSIALEELTFTDVDKVLQDMRKKGLSEKTIRNTYTMLQACWNYAVKYLSAHNKINLPVFPGKMITLPKLNNQKTCFLLPDEASLLLKTLYNWRNICKENGIHQRGIDSKDAYGMCVLSLLSGLRLGDICRLTWRDVELAFSYARTPKGGKAYGIHLDIPLVKEMLEERRTIFPNAKPDDFVFLDSIGGKRKEAPSDFWDAIDKLGFNQNARRINNPAEKINFHSLRHTFASWLAMAGTSLQTIMVLMGHESIQMTLRYARLNPAYTRQPVEEMAEGFAQQYKRALSDGEFSYIEANVKHEMDKKVFMLD